MLLQLLHQPAITWLCLLAFMAQAARTAVDLLLPIMRGAQVPPGVIGLLFAGEAVGSVVAPFVVDWLLSRHTSSSSSGENISGVGSSISSSSDSQSDGSSCSSKSCRKGALAGRPSEGSCSNNGPCSNNSSRSTQHASWLLLVPAVGMAVCCACVHTLWQLPAALHRRPDPALRTAVMQDAPFNSVTAAAGSSAPFVFGSVVDQQKNTTACCVQHVTSGAWQHCRQHSNPLGSTV